MPCPRRATISQIEHLRVAMTLERCQEAIDVLDHLPDHHPACVTSFETATIPTATSDEVAPNEATIESGHYLLLEGLATRLAIVTIAHHLKIVAELEPKKPRFCPLTKVLLA